MAASKRSIVFILPVLITLIVVMIFAVRFGISDVYFFQAERELVHWGERGEKPRPEQIAAASQLIDKALGYWSENPDYLVLQAQILGWKAFSNDSSAPYQLALNSLRRALDLRPAYAPTWALLAEMKTAVNEKDEEWQVAKEKALQFGGHDISMVIRMEKLGR